jgi:hypothetical protein
MSIQQVVTRDNLGADFDLGGLVADKLNIQRMVGATAGTPGAAGLVPAPVAGEQSEFLRADGTWQPPPTSSFGEAAGMPSNFAIPNNGITSYASMPLLVNLPMAGTYVVIASVRVVGTAAGSVSLRLFNTTANAEVARSRRFVTVGAGGTQQHTLVLVKLVTVPGANMITVQAATNAAGAVVYASTDSAGQADLFYFKLA